MSMIPVIESCRFISIEDINDKIKNDNFTYKSVRVLARVRQLYHSQTGYCIIESVIAHQKNTDKDMQVD